MKIFVIESGKYVPYKYDKLYHIYTYIYKEKKIEIFYFFLDNIILKYYLYLLPDIISVLTLWNEVIWLV
jgi:hypothetical protein